MNNMKEIECPRCKGTGKIEGWGNDEELVGETQK